MKLPTLFHSLLAAALLTPFSPIQCAPLETQDFSDDLRNFNQTILLLHNIRSLIGVPSSALLNPSPSFTGTFPLELHPLDLALLPAGYSFGSSATPVDNHLKPKDEIIKLDETQLIVICADSDDEHGFEWPMVERCEGRRTF
jgi:hypothetical protein